MWVNVLSKEGKNKFKKVVQSTQFSTFSLDTDVAITRVSSCLFNINHLSLNLVKIFTKTLVSVLHLGPPTGLGVLLYGGISVTNYAYMIVFYQAWYIKKRRCF